MPVPSESAEARIVCVESSKGGVGKTLVSLLLANEAQKGWKGNAPVILMDLDFTGTSVMDADSHPQTTDKADDDAPLAGTLNGICFLTPPSGDSSKGPATLIEMFDSLLSGNAMRSAGKKWVEKILEKAKNEENIVLLTSGRHHDQERRAAVETDDKKTAALDHLIVTGESMLIDDNHANWFIDFLEELIRLIADKARKAGFSQPPVFVLDNSPGNTALVSKLNDRLITRIEWDLAFVQVSSQDKMDQHACAQDIYRIEETAWHVGRAYSYLNEKTKDGFKPFKEEEWESFIANFPEIKDKSPFSAMNKSILEDFLKDFFQIKRPKDKFDTVNNLITNRHGARNRPNSVLIVNKVMPTSKQQIPETVRALIMAGDSDKGKEDSPLARTAKIIPVSLRFDPALAVFFVDEGFEGRADVPVAIDDLFADLPDKADEGADIVPGDLVVLDKGFIDDVIVPASRGDVPLAQRMLAPVHAPDETSHIARGMRIAANLVQVIFEALDGDNVRDRDMRTSGATFVEALMPFLGENLLGAGQTDGLFPVVQDVGMVRQFVGRRLGVGEIDAPVIREPALVADDIPLSFQDFMGALIDQATAYLLALVTYPSGYAKDGTLTRGAEILHGATQAKAREVVSIALKTTGPRALSAEILDFMIDHGLVEHGSPTVFHMPLFHAAQSIALYRKSLARAARSTEAWKRVYGYARSRQFIPSISALYLTSALRDLMYGIRTDHEDVLEQSRNLLAGNEGGLGKSSVTHEIRNTLGAVLASMFDTTPDDPN